MYNEHEAEVRDDLHGGMTYGDIQWERTMCLGGMLQISEVKPGFTQFSLVLEAKSVGVSL
jgi:hypothetical protein